MAPKLTVSSAPPDASSADNPANQPRQVWSVSRLNLEARALLESGFGSIWIEGEISNFAKPRSGHMYFSLKDSSCQVRCAMFKGQNRRLQFEPGNGQQVLARARVSLYAERGDYQLIVDDMEEGGVGALRRAFDALKSKLEAEGLFDADLKRAVPAFARQVGVLTSPTGAALHDVLTTLRRRFPALPVVLYPIPVQGAEAPDAIVAALAQANARAECDVLLLVRGGGSLEDLWAFNDERTARAVRASAIPVICGVGHEVDFTIADFVADQRAATPTAAAEAVTPDGDALALRVQGLAMRKRRAMQALLNAQQRQLQSLRHRLVHPATRLNQLSQHADLLTMRLQRAMESRLAGTVQRSAQLDSRLRMRDPADRVAQLAVRLAQARRMLASKTVQALEHQHARVQALKRALLAVGPAATLERGYAIALDERSGAVLRSAAAVPEGAAVKVRLAAGALRCTVTEVLPGE